jgi:two-component system sensor histidine kinase YesM
MAASKAFTDRLRQMKMATKIFWMTFVMVETMIVLLGYSYHQHSSGVLLTAQKEYAQQMVQKSNEYLELNLRNVRSLLTTVMQDSRLRQGSDREIEAWLNDNLIYFLPTLKNIHVIEEHNVIASTSRFGWVLFDNSDFLQFMDGLNEMNTVYWSEPYFSVTSGNTVTAAMLVSGSETKKKVLVIDLDLEKLYQAMFPDAPNQLHGGLILLDTLNQPIFGQKPFTSYDVYEHGYEFTDLTGSMFQGKWNQLEWTNALDKQYFITRSRSNMLDWQVVWMMDKTQLLKPLGASIRFAGMLAIISLLLSLLISWVMSKSITRPIRAITSSMDQISRGDFKTAISIQRFDELGLLAMNFNQMARRIDALIEDLKRTEETKKIFEFKALQAQIRPHFLFNTLNAISMTARQQEWQRVDSLISSLTNQLHYSLQDPQQSVTLREELAALESYLELMNIRYEGRFTWEFDVDPGTLLNKLPKFVLQPLIENAIFHGLAPKSGNGSLFVGTAWNGRHWEILLEDDGIGIPESKLEELRKSIRTDAMPAQSDRGGIGLLNVHHRLRMMFTSEYQMEITASSGMGTRMIIRLPIETLKPESIEKENPS